MSANPYDTNGIDVQALAARHLDLKAQIEDLKAEKTQIEALLRSVLDLGTHVAGPVRILIGEPYRRFDAAYAARIIPAELLPKVSRLVVDAKLAERELSGALFLACKVPAAGAQRRVLVSAVES
jgi:hypothetical protein